MSLPIPPKKKPVQLSYRQLGSVVAVAVLLGATQASLVNKAFFNDSSLARLELAKHLIDSCDAYSTVSSEAKDGYMTALCVPNAKVLRKGYTPKPRKKLKRKSKEEA